MLDGLISELHSAVTAVPSIAGLADVRVAGGATPIPEREKEQDCRNYQYRRCHPVPFTEQGRQSNANLLENDWDEDEQEGSRCDELAPPSLRKLTTNREQLSL